MNLSNVNNRYTAKRQITRLLCASMMLSALSLTACQSKDQDNEDAISEADTKNTESKNTDDAMTDSDDATQNGINADAMGADNPMSETTAAHVSSLEAEFVTKMLERQKLDLEAYNTHQAELAEKRSMSESGSASKTATTDATDAKGSDANSDNQNSQADANANNKKGQSDAENSATIKAKADSSEPVSSTNENKDSDLSEEELAELQAFEQRPLANVVFPPTKQLTATEISNQYRIALQSLYLPDEVPLATQAVNTLLNIALLTTPVFDDPELAERLVIKMPALARMLNQYQQWQLYRDQQSEELEKIKQEQIEAQEAQAAKLDELVKEFDSKIKDYDEQIAKYEKKLKKFE